MAAIIEIEKSKKGSVAMAAQVKNDRTKRKYPIAFFIFKFWDKYKCKETHYALS